MLVNNKMLTAPRCMFDLSSIFKNSYILKRSYDFGSTFSYNICNFFRGIMKDTVGD